MRANELISIPFNEKVYGIEIFHDDATDLVAVGLKNSIVIYQLTINENDPTSEKLQSQVIQAVSFVYLSTYLPFVTFIPRFLCHDRCTYYRSITILSFTQWHGRHQRNSRLHQDSTS